MVTAEAGNKGQKPKVRFKDGQLEPNPKLTDGPSPTKKAEKYSGNDDNSRVLPSPASPKPSESPKDEEIELQEASSQDSSTTATPNTTPDPAAGNESKKPSVKSEDMQVEPKPHKGGNKSLKPSKSPKGKKIKLPEVSPTESSEGISKSWGKPLPASRKSPTAPNDDPTKRWPFVDLREQLRLDKFDSMIIASPSSDPKFSQMSASFQLMSSLADLYGSQTTMDVIASLELQHKRRHQEQIESELKKIEGRIYKTLEEIGMEDGLKHEGETTKCTPVFDAAAENKKVQDRINLLADLEAFEEKSVTRNRSLLEISNWFEDHLDMCDDLETLEELKDAIAATKKIHEVLSLSLNTFIDTGEQVVEKGKMLLEETSKIIKERNALMSKRMSRGKIIVIEDKVLVDDSSKWESAASTVLSVFEESYKLIKNVSFRNDVRLSIKQFEFMNEAIKKKLKELEEKKQLCEDLKEQVNSLKMKCEKLNRDVEGEKKISKKIGNELVEAKANMVKLNTQIKELQQNIAELTSQIKLLTDELQLKNQTPAPKATPPPTAKTPKPEPEKIIVKVRDTAAELQLQQVEQELQNAKAEIETLVSQLSAIKEQLMEEQEQLRLYQERISELESELESNVKVFSWSPSPPRFPSPILAPSPPPVLAPSPPPVLAPLPPPVLAPVSEIPEPDFRRMSDARKTSDAARARRTSKTSDAARARRTSKTSDARRTSEVPMDSTSVKNVMARMKLEHQTEIEKVMSLVQKEQAMGEANIKKTEELHKTKLVTIQKDVIRMLRGIMHFRDHMMTCLEEQNLLEQCQALYELGDLVKEKSSLEAKDMLAAVVGTVIDYLNKMEGVITNSFLAIRLLMKHQIDKLVDIEVENRLAVKVVQQHSKEATGTSTVTKGLATSLETVKTKLVKKTEEDFVSDTKFQELMSRYSSMMHVYERLQKEMKILQADFHDTLQKKMELEESMLVSHVSLGLKQKSVFAEEQRKMSIADHAEKQQKMSIADHAEEQQYMPIADHPEEQQKMSKAHHAEQHQKMSIADKKENLRVLGRAYQDNKISKEFHSKSVSAEEQRKMSIVDHAEEQRKMSIVDHAEEQRNMPIADHAKQQRKMPKAHPAEQQRKMPKAHHAEQQRKMSVADYAEQKRKMSVAHHAEQQRKMSVADYAEQQRKMSVAHHAEQQRKMSVADYAEQKRKMSEAHHAEQQRKMSISDQKENLRLLCRAYQDNKISKELHSMATALIQTTMEIPRMKLRRLFEQYIAFRAVKDSKARVARVLEEEKGELPAYMVRDIKRNMVQYMESLDDRLRSNMGNWRSEMRTLEEEKRNLHNRIYNMFNEVFVETGVRFVHPLLGEKNATQAASRLNREKLKEILSRSKKRYKEILALPESIFGTAVPLGQGDTWSGERRKCYGEAGDMQKLPSVWMPYSQRYDKAGLTMLTTPHLLAYEINKPKVTALRSMYVRRARYVVGKTESFDITDGTCVHYIRDLANPANSPEPVELQK